MTGPAGVVHIAGMTVTINDRMRQRCAWCGALLINYDLANIAVPVTQADTSPASWPVGDLVLIDGNMAALVPHVDGAALPEAACGRLDPAVTA